MIRTMIDCGVNRRTKPANAMERESRAVSAVFAALVGRKPTAEEINAITH
jgi:hypothetical protein